MFRTFSRIKRLRITRRKFSTLATGTSAVFGFVCCLLLHVSAKAMKGKIMNATTLLPPPLSKRSFPSYITLAA